MNTVHKIECGRKVSSWTDTERAVLRTHYRKGGAKAVAEHLPHREIAAIYREAVRLNLSRKRSAYWADCQQVVTMLGLKAIGAPPSQRDKVADFFAARNVKLRRAASGKSAVLLASLAQWLATNPPEFDLRRVDQAWFVSKMLRDQRRPPR